MTFAIPAPGLIYLDTLDPGERFQSGDRRGTVKRKSFTGVTVQWDGKETVEVAGKTFQRPLAAVQIAGHTEVTRIPLPEIL